MILYNRKSRKNKKKIHLSIDVKLKLKKKKIQPPRNKLMLHNQQQIYKCLLNNILYRKTGYPLVLEESI